MFAHNEGGSVTNVHLPPITAENFRDCISLKVDASQAHLVASNLKFLAGRPQGIAWQGGGVAAKTGMSPQQASWGALMEC